MVDSLQADRQIIRHTVFMYIFYLSIDPIINFSPAIHLGINFLIIGHKVGSTYVTSHEILGPNEVPGRN